MPQVTVDDYRAVEGWSAPADGDRSRYYCRKLEEGEILFFSAPPFHLPNADQRFLISQRQSGFKGHKNISYRPLTDELRGAAATNKRDASQLHAIMRMYSKAVTKFVDQFLAPYAEHRRLDFASFRPIEEQNRDLPATKRNDLMHVDAFPTRPTRGGRILRVFTNINPERERVWETTDGFPAVARSFADGAGLRKFAASAASPSHAVLRKLAPLLKAVGMKGADRSAYDRFMLHFHDYLKLSDEYQTKWTKYRLSFPPGSTWMVYTDQVPHAALSGQFALEQTYIIPMQAMVAPELSPLRVLESMCGTALSN